MLRKFLHTTGMLGLRAKIITPKKICLGIEKPRAASQQTSGGGAPIFENVQHNHRRWRR
jgi:hypothetical protein